MTQSLQMQLCAMILMLLVCYFSFNKHTVILKSMLLYRHLLLVTTGCVAADIISIIGIAHADQPLTDILCKVYLFFVIWTSFLSFNYVCYDIVKIRRMSGLRRSCMIFTLVSSIALFFLPIEVFNSKDEIYSFGPAVTYTFVIAPIFIIASMILILICKKHMNPYRSNAVFIWMLMETAGAVIQINNRSVLLVSFTMALGVTILFAKLENPDSGIERVTGCYRASLLREYIQQLYDNDDKERAVIIIENDELEREFSAEAIMLIEIANFLKGLNCGNVFHGIENDFVIVLDDVSEAKRVFPVIKERFEMVWHDGNILHPHYLLIPSITVFESISELFATYRYFSNMTEESSESFFIIDSEALEKMKEFRFMQSEIKSALKENRFVVFLQPIYSVTEGRFVSAEALVRMKSRDGTLIMPGSFIPIAEETGQIEQIGERVFEIVCDVIKEHEI
ncbi:MAG: EAL domain-containing protein [Ruminococcus sp.]|nr:EAL domain-containing protein [Ruminococcus sp.]